MKLPKTQSTPFLKLISFHIAIISLVFQSIIQSAVFTVPAFLAMSASSSFAAEITPDDPAINVYEQNNVNVIEIKQQNGAGLSHNKFIDYNAISKDQAINNSAADGNSQLAGATAGNSNFGGNSAFEASKILFEVSGSSTRLEKNIEIFGKKADFILANSKGIMCNGCGFINTSAVSFITGNVVDASDPNNIKYQINSDKNASVLIDSGGITFYGNNNSDDDNNFNLNLISRAIRIAGELKVQNNAKLNQLNVRSGAGEFQSGSNSFTTNYQNSDSNNIVNAGDSADELSNQGFAVVIDSTALGGMRAGQISIIATEEGAGVKTDIDLISDLGSVDISANGDIIIKKNINSQNNINLTSATNITNSGNLTATTNLNLTSTSDLTNSGQITASSAKISAQNITNSNLISANTLFLTAANDINNNAGATISSTSGDLTLKATNGTITNLGNLTAATNLNLDSLNNLTNSGTISGANLDLNSASITNSGNLTAASNLDLTSAGNITNSGQINASSATISAQNITNSNLISANTLSLTATNNITNNAGATIRSAAGDITLNSTNGSVTNSGNLTAASNLNLDSLNNITNSGTISGVNLNLTSSENLNNSGQITASKTTISAQNIINSNLISAAILSLTATNNITNNAGATIRSTAGDLTLNSTNGTVTNSGSLTSAAKLDLTSLVNLTNSGTISGANLDLNSASITNSGSLTATLNLDLDSLNNITNSGTISGVNLDLTSEGNITNSGQINAINTTISAQNITNSNLISANTLSLTATNNTSATIRSTSGDLTLNSTNGGINNSGSLTAASNLNLDSLNNITNSGTISGVNLDLNSASITNSGNLTATLNLDLTSEGNITNSGQINAINTTISAQNIINSNLISAAILSLTATNNITNNAGAAIRSTAGDLTLNSTNGTVTNSGSLTAASNLNLDSLNNITNSGTISGANLDLNSASITNSGNLTATLNLDLTSAGNITNSGQINASNTTISAQNITNSNLISANTLSLTAANDITNNANATIRSTAGNLTLNLNGTLTNDSHIISSGDLIVLGQGNITNNANGDNIKLSAGNSIKITAKKLINNQNLDLKGGFLTLSNQADSGLVNNALITSTNADLVINGAMQNNSSGIMQSQLGHNIVLNSLAGAMINAGQIKTDNELHLSGQIINQNIIARIDDINPLDAQDKKYLKIVINDGILTNDINGQIITNNYLLIDGNNKSGSLTNHGIIRSNHLSDVNNFNDDDVINIKNINALNNSGIIDSAEDLVVSAGEINNNSGLLFAGLDTILNTNSLTNDNANIIASSGDIKIQKEIVTNQDGSEDYIKANEINNINGGQIKTLKSKVDAPLFSDNDVRRVLEIYATEMLSTNNFSPEELNRRLYALRGYLKNSDLSIEEQMNQSVSGNIKIHANSLKNDSRSIISSNNYIKINADKIINDRNSVLASANYFDIITNDLQNLNNSQIFGATVLNIKSDNIADLNNQIVNSGLIRSDAIYLNSAKIINNSGAQAQIDSLGDLFGKEFSSNDYGFIGNNLFILNNDGNFLITINKDIAESTDNDILLNDFLSKINSTSNLQLSAKLLGDDIYLSNFIANLLQNQTSSRYLTFDATSDSAQLKSFLDSTANQMQNLGIAFGSELTAQQRSNLNAPFISFKKQEVFVKDGNVYNTQIAGSSRQEIYIPTILTPLSTTQNQETSNIASQNARAIEARNELVMNATSQVRNSSQIKAGTIAIETQNFTNELSNQTLTLDANGNLMYVASSNSNTKTPAITAKDNIFITAKNNFNNNSADITAGNNLVISAGNNFNVSSDSNSNSSGLKSNFSAANIAINSANANINNLDLGSNSLILDVDNNLNLQNSNITSNDIYLSNLKGFAQIGRSNINTNSSLNINAAGNVDILASNIKADGLQISSGNNLAMSSSNINSSYLVASSSGNTNIEKSNINSGGDVIILAAGNFALTNSNLNAGSTQINSGGVVDILGSAINSSNYTTIAAKNDFNLTNSSLNAQGLILDSGANLNINKSNLQTSGGENGYLQISAKNNFNLNSSNIDSNNAAIINAGGNANILSSNIKTDGLQISAGNNLAMSSSNINSSGLTQIDSGGAVNILGSAINSSNHTIITAKNDFNLTDSSLNAQGLILDSGANFNIDKSNLQTSGGAEGYLQISAKNNFNLSNSNIDSNAAYISAGNNINLNDNNIDTNIAAISSGNNINLLGNNINAADTLQIAAGGDLNISTRQTTTNSSSSNKTGRSTQSINSTATTHSGFNSLSGGNIVLSSGRDTNITAANLNADNTLQIDAGGNLNIQNATNTTTTTTNTATQYDQLFHIKKRRYGIRTLTAYDTKATTQTTDIASNLSGANILLSSGKDLNVNKSNIKATGDNAIDNAGGYLQISAKNNFNLGSSNIDSKIASISSGNNINLNDSNIDSNVTAISSGNDTNLIGNKINADDVLQIAAGGNLNITTRQTNTSSSSSKSNGRSTQNINSTTTTHSGFNSLSGGDIVLSSGKDTNIIGASLNADETLQINAGGNLNIKSAADITNTNIQSSQTKRVSWWGKTATYKTSQSQTTTNKETATTLNAGNIYLSSGNQLSITGAKINTNDLIASAQGQITFRQNQSKTTGTLALINERNFINAESATKTQSASTKSSSLTSAPANIIYEAGQVQDSAGDLVLMTSADIINHGSLIAGGNINLSANNITNSRTAVTTHSGRSFSTTLTGEALIQAGGSVFMKATNDINNYAGTIIARDGDITLLAGGNVNIGSVELKNRTVTSGGRKKRAWTSVVETTTNVGSNISAGSNIIIKAGNNDSPSTTNDLRLTTNKGNINITGSNLTSGTNATTSATNGSNIIMNAANNLNIKSSVDSFNSRFAARKFSSSTSRTTNNKSNLIAGSNSTNGNPNGNIYINTLNIDETTGSISIPASLAAKDISNNVNIIGSDLKAKDNIAIAADNNINNIGGRITGTDLVSLNAGGNINNKALINYNIGGVNYNNYDNLDDAGQSQFSYTKSVAGSKKSSPTQVTINTTIEEMVLSSNARNISSTLIDQGNIESDGNVIMTAGGNINNIGSNIKAGDSLLLESLNGNINIQTALLRNKTTQSGGKKRKSWTRITDNITNISSNIEASNNLTLNSTYNLNIIGSNLKSEDADINLNALGSVNILNAKDSKYSFFNLKKRGMSKASNHTSVNYQETAVNSNLLASNITINSGNNASDAVGGLTTQSDGNILIRSSNLQSKNNTNLNADNVIIVNDILNSYSYSHTSRSYRGIAKVGANITSTVIGLTDMVANLAYNLTSPLLTEIDDPVQKLAKAYGMPDFITDKIDPTYARDKKNDLKNTSLYNIKQKINTNQNATTISSSNLNAGNNININANQDTTIIASNINAGTDRASASGQLNITADNLSILADQETNFSTYENKTTRTLQFKNWNQGNFNTKTINSQLTSKDNTNFNFNITNTINTSYDARIFDSKTGIIDQQYAQKTGVDTSALQYLTHTNNNPTNKAQTLYNPIEEQQKQWADATRGLTGAGTAVVVIAAVAATILTAGAAAPVTAAAATAGTVSMATATFTVGTAVAGAAASTAATSATNTSMNLDGDIFKQAKGIGKQTIKDTTSQEALESYAIAGGTALLTMGLTVGFDKIATMTNTTATASTNIAATTNTTLTNTITTKLATAAKTSLIQSISSSTVQSAINGDSFSEAFRESTKNLLINTAGAMAANQIGGAAKIGDITRTEQLILHATLGCAMASAGGNNCASGAAAGVMGEISAGYLDKNTNLSNPQIIEGSKLIGAITAAMMVGDDDGASVFAGSQIARNAAENNYLMPQEKSQLVKDLKDCHGDSSCQKQLQAKYEVISDLRDEKLESYAYKCMAFGNCEKFDKINEDLKLTTTFEGNNYYNSLTPEQKAEQFVLLPPEKAIYHNYPVENGNIDLLNQTDYKKYIHPVMGYEVVVDNKGNLVTDHLNIGTYNFYNPSGYGYNNPLITSDKKHIRYDVAPYFVAGNSDQDPSSFYQRSSRAVWLYPSINEKALSIRNSIQNLGNK